MQPASTTADRRLRVFLSYAREDHHAVLALYERLEADGFQPWMDKKDLLPGQKWEVEIPRQVHESDVVIVCLSTVFAKKTGYGQKEIALALDTAESQPEHSIFVIPLRLEECEVPERLHHWQWGNLFEDDGYDPATPRTAPSCRAARHPAPTAQYSCTCTTCGYSHPTIKASDAHERRNRGIHSAFG